MAACGALEVTPAPAPAPAVSSAEVEGRMASYHVELTDMKLVRHGGISAVYKATLGGDKVYAKFVPRRRDGSAIRLQSESDILAMLKDSPKVVDAVAFGLMNEGVVLAVKDEGGKAVTDLVGSLSLLRALEIAREVALALVDVHAAKIIHKDVNPSNIVVLPDERVLLIDFGLATRSSWEKPVHREGAEGTLAYIAPEQTGRINRSVDSRADIYSLGATLYELLVGHPPFSTRDPAELLHAHIARYPAPPHSLKPDEIPLSVSLVVAKMMAKSPEQRYQSALGVARDLQRCMDLVTTNAKEAKSGSSLASPTTMTQMLLGRDDAVDTFRPGGRLYGRDGQVRELLELYEAVAKGGTRLALVRGYSGIGKTSLVHEMYRSILRPGHHVQGKFNQLQRTSPYSAIVEAVSQLVEMVLSSPQEDLEKYSVLIKEALGVNGQVLCDVVPDLDAIIGAQPEVESLPAATAKARFEGVFLRFIQAFCAPKEPLCLFLDDLQWADSASLSLIEMLATNQIEHLFLIGAYRDNEVDLDHPLSMVLGRIKQHDKAEEPLEMALLPLDPNTVLKLVSDAVRWTTDADEVKHASEDVPETVRELAEIVQEKTAGNPFFVVQFLYSIHAAGLFSFNYVRLCWDIVNVKDVLKLPNTDNVVDLLIDKVRQLPEKTQNVLRTASAIGNQFELGTLATVLEVPGEQVFDFLLPALEARLIVRLGQQGLLHSIENRGRLVLLGFAFLHDRVQQAAYCTVEPTDRPALHLHIARLLSRSTDGKRRPSLLQEKQEELRPSEGTGKAVQLPPLDDSKQKGSLLPNDGKVVQLTPLGEQQKEALLPEEKVPEEKETAGKVRKLFILADHYNCALEMLTDLEERSMVARLNLRCCQHASTATAYAAALQYAHNALELAGGREHCWTVDFEFAVVLYRELVAAESLNYHFDASRELTLEAVEKVDDPVTKAGFYHNVIVGDTVRGRYAEALVVARTALDLLGVNMPAGKKDLDACRDATLTKIANHLENLPSVRSLDTLRECSDLRWRTAVLLMTTMGPPSSRSDQSLWGFIVAESVWVCLQHGHVSSVVYSYTSLCGLMAYVRQRFDWCADLAWLSLRLSEKYKNSSDRTVALLMVGSSVRHWFDSMHRAEGDYQLGYQVGLDSSNLHYAYCFGHDMYLLFFSGMALPLLKEQLERYHAFATTKKNQWAVEVIEGVDLAVSELSGGTLKPISDEAEYLKRIESHGSMQVVCVYSVVRARALYFLGDLDEAWRLTQTAEAHIGTVATQGLLVWAEHVVTRALLACALLRRLHRKKEVEEIVKSVEDSDEYKVDIDVDEGPVRQQLEADVKTITKWARAAPASFEARLALIEAELSWVDSLKRQEQQPEVQEDHWGQLQKYGRAIELCERDNFPHISAAAHRRAGEYLQTQQSQQLYVAAHVKSALGKVVDWGAGAVSRSLHSEYATTALLDHRVERGTDHRMISAVGRGKTKQRLDRSSHSSREDAEDHSTPVSSVVRSNSVTNSSLDAVAASLTEQDDDNSLGSKLMTIVMQTAGANRGALLLCDNDTWTVSARARLRDEIVEVDEDVDVVVPADSRDVPMRIVRFSVRRNCEVVVNDLSAKANARFQEDPFFTSELFAPRCASSDDDPSIRQQQPPPCVSVACLPLSLRTASHAVLLLYNTLASNSFSPERVTALRTLSQQVAVTMDYQRLFAQFRGLYDGAVTGLPSPVCAG